MSETPSHFRAVCPHCLVGLKVPISFSGSNVRRKHCDHKFRAIVPDHPMTPGSDEFLAAALNIAGPEADRFDVICPECSTHLRIRSTLAGQHVRCKQCNQKFLVPKVEEIPAPIGQAGEESPLADPLHGQPEHARSAAAEPRMALQPPESDGELKVVRGENENLLARLAALEQNLAEVQAERESLRVQFEQIGGDHHQLQSKHEEYRQTHHRVRDELASIRDALGEFSPAEIMVLRTERQSLGDENQRLAGQVQSLQSELTANLGLAQSVADREEELRLTGLRVGELIGQVELLQNRLKDVHEEREQLGEQLRNVEARLGHVEAERNQLSEQIAEDARARELSQVRLDELVEQLRQRDSELAGKHEELERLAALRVADSAAADELRDTLTRREQEFQQEIEPLRLQLDELQRTLATAEQMHGEEETGSKSSASLSARNSSRADRKSKRCRAASVKHWISTTSSGPIISRPSRPRGPGLRLSLRPRSKPCSPDMPITSRRSKPGPKRALSSSSG